MIKFHDAKLLLAKEFKICLDIKVGSNQISIVDAHRSTSYLLKHPHIIRTRHNSNIRDLFTLPAYRRTKFVQYHNLRLK